MNIVPSTPNPYLLHHISLFFLYLIPLVWFQTELCDKLRWKNRIAWTLRRPRAAINFLAVLEVRQYLLQIVHLNRYKFEYNLSVVPGIQMGATKEVRN